VIRPEGNEKGDVYPLAGKIAVDGQPPNVDRRNQLLVMLNDPAQPDTPLEQPPKKACDSEGSARLGRMRSRPRRCTCRSSLSIRA